MYTRTATHTTHSLILALLVLTVVAFTAAACGRANEADNDTTSTESGQTGRTGREIPTMPPARFAAPTTMIDATKVAESGATPQPGAPDVEFGAQTYARLCAECHGETGEGIPDKGEAVTAMETSEALTDLLRTGGGYGPEHLFGPDKISPDGIAALHAFMQTLPVP